MKNFWFSYNDYRIDKLFKNQPILTNSHKQTSKAQHTDPLKTRLVD